MTATSCPTVVPGMFVVGCHGDGRLGHYPGSCGEQTAPPSRPTVGGWLEGACPRGCFRLSVCGFTKISMSEETKKGWGTISDERTLKELWQLNTGVIGSLLDEQLGKHLHGGVKISRLLG